MEQVEVRSYEEFAKAIRKLSESRKYKIRNSYGIYDGYKYYRKNKPKDRKYILSESQYFAITRKINNILAEALSRGEDIIFPYKLGRLEIRKNKSIISLKGDKVKAHLPIDWDKTLRLWYEDKEAFTKKILVKMDEKEIYKVYYNKNIAEFINKTFYQFEVNKELKRKLKQNIKEGKIDAFLMKGENYG